MNVFDKIINSVAPVHGVKRAVARARLGIIKNSGYSEGGASHTKKSMRGFTGVSSSPLDDIDANLSTLRTRSRQLYMTAPIATSALKTTRTNVVGAGLKLKANIDYEILGLSAEEAEKWESTVEREFALWADTTLCDALRLNNFYEMQQLIFLGELLNGDGLCLIKQHKPSSFMPYGIRLHVIESDRLSTPNCFAVQGGDVFFCQGVNESNGNEIYSGIEIDKEGMTVAYHICNRYPYSGTISSVNKPFEWTRVEAFGKQTGRPNIIHLFTAERAEQRRGVPMLSPVIETLKQLSRYTDAELMAAVIASMFTVFVKTKGPTNEMNLGEGIAENAPPIQKDFNDYELGNGAIVNLAPDEDIEIADPKRPSTAFDGYIKALTKQIGSALEVPNELLLKEFTSSYSASRGALLEAWKMFKMQREWLSKGFCQPVYELFLAEAVARGRIKAPGFFADPIIKKAWCSADWNGAAMGTLDPTREVQAAKMRVEEGFSNREEETMGLTGGNYVKNAKQLARENKMLTTFSSIQKLKETESAYNADTKSNN